MNDDDLRPIGDFAHYFPGRSQKTLWFYRNRGYGGDPNKRLECVRIGRNYYTTRSNVLAFLAKIVNVHPVPIANAAQESAAEALAACGY